MATTSTHTDGNNSSNGNGATNGKQVEDKLKWLNRFEDIVTNVSMMRTEFMKALIDPRRSIEKECGYPEDEVGVHFYQDLYNRDAVAVRVVQVLPRECWQVQPQVYESEDNRTVTAFEKALRALSRGLYTEDSYYQDDDESLVWEYLRRGDELSGIGSYGGILLGFNDIGESGDLASEVRLGTATDKRELMFMRCFPEGMIRVDTTNTSPGSRRFGQPETYKVTLADTETSVHWSRILHLADNLDTSEWQGAPRMRPVLNRLLDLNKLYAGSAEMYWRGAFPGVSLETHPNLSPEDISLDEAKLKDMMENYGNGLQRYLALMGMTAKSLAPQVVDPTPQIRVQIEAICIRLGVPKRIFMGSERGELASIQDDKTWNDRLKERQRNYVTPRIIRPFIDRLINLGVLPKPKQYVVKWPDMSFQTEQDKVKVAIVKTEAIIRFAQSLPNPLITPEDFWALIMNITQKEAEMILQHVKDKGWDNVLPGLKSLMGEGGGAGGKGGGQQSVKFGGDPTSGLGKGTFIQPKSGNVISDTDGGVKIPSGDRVLEDF